jgi:DNA repair exonuclease SbcCD ATPase subunit
MKKLKIRVKKPWIGYSGTPVQQNYAEELDHGYLLWDIKGKSDWDVGFKKLPNPKPYVTIPWNGDVDELISSAAVYPDGSRFRVRSSQQLGQKDIKKISELLRSRKSATEVTFKSDYMFDKSIVKTEDSTLEKTDLRNPEKLLKLVKDYHKSSSHSEDLWTQSFEHIKRCLSTVITGEDTARNSKWSLRYLGFDNMFSYGEGNVINFDGLNGIVGIFGPNRAGKSSIIGTLMYSLFNATDRGPMKNIHICNVRKQYCSSRAVINHSGTDYVIERQTTKSENKRGVVSAATALNVFRIRDDGAADDLAGEQRVDTEKVIKMLIGNQEDFLMTSLSAQGETSQFISQGSTRRRAVLSRFLDLDIFDKMYEISNKDLNLLKAQLKNFPDKDWVALSKKLDEEIIVCRKKLEEISSEIEENRHSLSCSQFELSKHKDAQPVTPSQVAAHRERTTSMKKRIETARDSIDSLSSEIDAHEKKLGTIGDVKRENDISQLRARFAAQRELESSLLSLRHLYDKEVSRLEQQKKSLKILDEVPCGDDYPTCKFIKDAHSNKEKLQGQSDEVRLISEKLSVAEESFASLKHEDVQKRIEKVEKLVELEARLTVELSKKKSEKTLLESQLESSAKDLATAEDKLNELENALKNEENAEVVSLRSKIENILKHISELDSNKIEAATRLGKLSASVEKLHEERSARDEILDGMKALEIVSSAFSKKGLPLIITRSQLPIVNAEIARVLHGIVDFSIELENDEDSDSTEIYINYGDSRRVIELCSGMEKTIASLAVRVAMINTSSLPRPDIFIIDEGFGTLDDAAVEACNRMLVSLKKYFRVIVVITHVDGIKDVVDHVIEITKSEKDTKVFYE